MPALLLFMALAFTLADLANNADLEAVRSQPCLAASDPALARQLFMPILATTPRGTGMHKLMVRSSKKCVDVMGGTNADGVVLGQYVCFYDQLDRQRYNLGGCGPSVGAVQAASKPWASGSRSQD